MAEAAGTIVPAVLKKAVRMVVWDFDLTLMKLHTYAKRIQPDDVIKRRWEDDFVDLEFFRKLVAELKAAGITFAVASFGKYETIQAYLTLGFPGGDFNRKNISTPGLLPGGVDGFQQPQGKQFQIKQLVTELFGDASAISLDEVLLIDDDERNIKYAEADGCKAALVTEGFDEWAWNHIVKEVLKSVGKEEGKE